MSLYYNGAGSQADLMLNNEDWTQSSVKTLSMAFHGTPGNTGQLYVKINNVKIAYDQAATDIANASWLVWHIDLTAIDGADNVTQLSIGVDGSDAEGLLYIDEVALYAQSPETVTPVTPDTANLVARYAFDGKIY